jgi:hypothetical protein
MDSSFRRLRWVRLGVEERPYAAFVLSLVGGVLILVGGLLGLTWLGWPMWGWWGMGMMWGWMPGFLLAFSAGGFIIGALLGIVGGLLALTWRRPT